MPDANSKPARLWSNRILATFAFSNPLSSLNVVSSIKSYVLVHIFATTPLIPSSFTKILLPFPINFNGTPIFRVVSIIFSICSTLFNLTNISAFPPILKVVCLLIGSFK